MVPHMCILRMKMIFTSIHIDNTVKCLNSSESETPILYVGIFSQLDATYSNSAATGIL